MIMLRHKIGPTEDESAIFKCNFSVVLVSRWPYGGLTRWEMGLESRRRTCMALHGLSGSGFRSEIILANINKNTEVDYFRTIRHTGVALSGL